MPPIPEPLQKAVHKIREFHNRHGRMPSYSEMAALFGYASKRAAQKLAQKMAAANLIEADSKGKLIPRFGNMGIPLAGYVQAGFPSPAEEELVDTMTLDQYLIKRPEASFLLKVTGDSMIDAGILPNDIVIVERGRDPRNGDIVLAQIDREWTLKYYQRSGKTIALRPANPKYPVLHPKEELQIAGVIVATVRRYR